MGKPDYDFVKELFGVVGKRCSKLPVCPVCAEGELEKEDGLYICNTCSRKFRLKEKKK